MKIQFYYKNKLAKIINLGKNWIKNYGDFGVWQLPEFSRGISGSPRGWKSVENGIGERTWPCFCLILTNFLGARDITSAVCGGVFARKCVVSRRRWRVNVDMMWSSFCCPHFFSAIRVCVGVSLFFVRDVFSGVLYESKAFYGTTLPVRLCCVRDLLYVILHLTFLM